MGLPMTPRTRSVPVLESTLLSLKLIVPLCGKSRRRSSVSSESPTSTGISASCLDLILPSRDQAAEPEHRPLVDVEVDVHRVERDDRRQGRLVGLDQVPRVDHPSG